MVQERSQIEMQDKTSLLRTVDNREVSHSAAIPIISRYFILDYCIHQCSCLDIRSLERKTLSILL